MFYSLILISDNWVESMNKFNVSINDIKDNMMTVTEPNVYWWSYCYWDRERRDAEEKLKTATDKEEISFYRFCLVEAMKILSELYDKLITMPEFKDGMLSKPDWMDSFLNTT